MEILYFILGIVTVLLIGGVVVIVRVYNDVRGLKQARIELERDYPNDIDRIYRHIDTVSEDLLKQMDKKIDSRLDKFENRIRIDDNGNVVVNNKLLVKGEVVAH